MGLKVLITLTEKESAIVNSHMIKKFQEKGVEVITCFSNAKLSEDEVVNLIKDVDGYIFGLEDITKTVLMSGTKLKVVCKHGIGTDNVDKQTAKELGIKVTNCQGLNSLAVAELVVASMLGLARDIFCINNAMKNGIWDSSLGTELSRKTLGIIGMGNVGKNILKLLSGFNMKVLVYDIVADYKLIEEYEFEYTGLEQLYKESDYITLNIPLTEETRNLITLHEMKMMKPNVSLINMARGGIVNEDDLLTALNQQIISSAAIDAFREEPTRSFDLVNHPRVIAFPHIGASTQEATIRIGECCFQNIYNVITGKEPVFQVD